MEQRAKDSGIKDGDRIIKMLGIELNSKTIEEIFSKRDSMKAGDSYEMVVIRNGETIKLNPVLFTRMTRHIFEEIENLTDEQRFLKERWSRNL